MIVVTLQNKKISQFNRIAITLLFEMKHKAQSKNKINVYIMVTILHTLLDGSIFPTQM